MLLVYARRVSVDHPLSDAVLLDVHSAAVNVGLTGSRGALLAGIARGIVAQLPAGQTPAAQLRTDLDELNRHELDGGARPIRTWLRNALQLAPLRAEARVFQRALDLLAVAPVNAVAAAPVQPQAPAPAPKPNALPARLPPSKVLEVSQVLQRVLRAARVSMETLVAQLDMDLWNLRDDDWLGLVKSVEAGRHGPIGDGRDAVLALVEAARTFVPANAELKALAAALGGAAAGP